MAFRRSNFLIAAFTALFVVCGAASLAIWQTAEKAQARERQLHERELSTLTDLSDIRNSVYQRAVVVRDFALDLTRQNLEEQRRQLDAAQAPVHASLNDLSTVLAAEGVRQENKQAESVRSLEGDLNYFFSTARALIDAPQPMTLQQRSDILKNRGQKRAEILTLMSQIEDVAATSAARERESLAASQAALTISLRWISGIAVLLGLGIAVLTIIQMLRLERQSEFAQAELRRLSAELRTAQEQERRSLSRELHDQVGQMLTGLRLELSALARRGRPDPELDAGLDHAKGVVEQTLKIVRNIAMLLRPSMLDDLGLTPALQWLAREMSRSSGVEIQTQIDARADSLPDAHRTCLYRVVQEALTNALKHAGTRVVRLQVEMLGTSVRAVISDEGYGFDGRKKPQSGFGLMGMEERVRELRGQFRLTSALGCGTTVEILLPVPVQQPLIIEGSSNEDSIDRGRSRDRQGRPEVTI